VLNALAARNREGDPGVPGLITKEGHAVQIADVKAGTGEAGPQVESGKK